MLKKKITYINFEGKTVTEDFYFNLTKAELAELEYSIPGGFESIRGQIEATLSEGRDIVGALLEAYKIIIGKAVGYKSLDGRSFGKSKEFSESFLASDAYSELVLELMNGENTDKIEEFFDNVLVGAPIGMKEATSKAKKELEEKFLLGDKTAESDGEIG